MRGGDRPLSARASDDDLGRRLAAHLDARVRGRCAADLAVTRGDPPRPAVAWVPASEAREPALLTYSVTKAVTAARVLLLTAGVPDYEAFGIV